MELLTVDEVYTNIYTEFAEVKAMEKAKIFTNGGSQAVRLPKSCRFTSDEVLVNRLGDIVILIPDDGQWSSIAAGLSMFTDDFLREGIEDPVPEEREEI